jgi:hypothetical protein
MINVKDTAASATKFVQRASAATQDYANGIAGAGSTWESHSAAAESSWEQGVTQAATSKRFAKGIVGKGAKYTANATKLGAVRYGPGVQNAQAAYQQGVQPYFDKLKSLNLPPKGPRGAQQNQQRANMVALELNKLRVGQ